MAPPTLTASYGHSRDLHIDAHGIRHTLLILQGLIKLFNRIRVDVEHELLAAQAWMAWLRYGMLSIYPFYLS